jgi:hypothetical protein
MMQEACQITMAAQLISAAYYCWPIVVACASVAIVEDNEAGGIVLTTLGAILMFIGFFFTLFTVRYAPPGGSGIVGGHRISAFTDAIGGWQFAFDAQWTHLLAAIGIFVTPIIVLVFNKATDGSIRYLAHPLQALWTAILAFGWLGILGIGILEGYLTMPANGEQGILPSFEANPLAPGYQGVPGPVTPHFTPSFGIGFWLVLAGLVIGALGVWQFVIPIGIASILLLTITHFVDHPLFTWLVTWIY